VSSSPQSRRSKSSSTAALGQLAETFVAQWLRQQNWQLIEQRWHCRWGELDLVMLTPNAGLAFVEIKARSKGNWDSDGLLAITATKQAKLVRAGEAFLAAQPQWANLPCRFDVAVVQARPCPSATPINAKSAKPIQFGQPVAVGPYYLTLQHYISGAFD
jgi:putative endonuclease